MSILLQVQSGEKSFGSRSLFSKASFSVEKGEHIGVIGPNGAGKTTLFRILAGQDSLDGGTITTTQGMRLGYLQQEEVLSPTETAAEYIERVSERPMWELYQLAFGLGLSDEHLQKPIRALSGGFRMRCQLLGQLGREPHLILLDEPTNYLDLESLLALEEFLIDYPGAFLLISHDREFLKRVTDHTLEIEAGDFTKFNGHIDDYFEQKAMLDEQLRTRALSLENKRQEILEFARKYGAKATKARQVQSRLKSLNKMEKIELKPLPVKARIRIPEPIRTGKLVVSFDNVSLGYGEKTVLKNVNLQMVRGTHLGVVGVNGAGKSTLLKAVAGQLSPLSGQIQFGPTVEVGYYSQHVAENLKLDQTVYEALAEVAHKDLTMQNIRDLAGQLLFSDERIDEKLLKMSGGEKARVALGRILVQRTPLLVMDEPTNHLDFHTVEALTEALRSYEGSLIVVSHDRSFIGRVAGQILQIKDGSASVYPGTYQEYVWSLQKGVLADSSDSTPRGTAATKNSKTSEKNSSQSNLNATSRSESRSPRLESEDEPGDQDYFSGETGDGPETRSPLSKEERVQNRLRMKEAQKRISYLDKKLERLNQELEELNTKAMDLRGEDAQKAMIDLAYRQKEIAELEEDWLETQSLIDQLS